MCIDCGCGHSPELHDSGRRKVLVGEDLLAKNNRLASENRSLFNSCQLLALNLVSSPGSGKTTLLERTLVELKNRFAFAVLEGDQQTSNDADRIASTGVPVKQINTGAGCHLDAHMTAHGVETFALSNLDILFIENVGNLVCPAAFDLGEDHKVVVLSVTEGEDKPLKYPQMFEAADLLLLNKTDLLPYLHFDLDQCKRFAKQVNPRIQVIEISCMNGSGLNLWYNWLEKQLSIKRNLDNPRHHSAV